MKTMVVLFFHSTIRHENAQVFGTNINGSNVEVKVEMEHFIPMTFNYFYMGNGFCMKLEDVLEVFRVLMLENFLNQFIFIWGCEQCS